LHSTTHKGRDGSEKSGCNLPKEVEGLYFHGKKTLDLLVRCLEQVPKNILPDGGFDEFNSV